MPPSPASSASSRGEGPRDRRARLRAGRQRGFLAPYTAALTKIETELASLGSAAQEPVRAGGPSLAGLIAQKRDFAARVITARREQGFEAATELVRTGEGKRLMDAIRVEAATRQDASAQRLATLQAQEHRRGLILFLLSGMAALGAIVLLARLALVRRQSRCACRGCSTGSWPMHRWASVSSTAT